MKSPEKHWLFRPIENHLCMVLGDFVLGLSDLFFEINPMVFRSGKEVPEKLNYNPIRSLPTLSQKD
jgi:hypothetical protein